MPWREASAMSLRLEFVTLARHEDANIRALCRQYGISSRTAYKWLARYREQGASGLQDRNPRPLTSPGQTAAAMEQLVQETRQAHPAWGGRKIKAYLEQAGHADVPAASTVTAILRRHGQLDAQEAAKHTAWQRFERAQPNELWQMDFKGHFALADGQRCHPLTVLDDHARYLVGLQACPDETGATVQAQLSAIFRRYGLPECLLCDNGAPWGYSAEHPHTALTAWLMRLGVQPRHGRPAHPQTQGKDERLHRTLQAELLSRYTVRDLATCQQYFDDWRQMYNEHRPHEALRLAVPATRYRPSLRVFPEQLPPYLYPPEYDVRKVQTSGDISFQNRDFRISKAFAGEAVGLCWVASDQCDIYFCQYRIGQISLADPPEHQAVLC